MLLVTIFTVFSAALATYDLVPVKRAKRQYYVCDFYPNQFYSYYPCSNNGVQTTRNPIYGYCTNGGQMIGVGCIYSYQCTPYTTQTVQCLNGCCCTSPFYTQQPPIGVQGFCYNGQRATGRCSTSSGCSVGQTCMNGLCCRTTGLEYQYACGGQAALASCVSSQCGQFICTSSNYCCECQYGQTAGTCANGCGSGYRCSSSGYCCPQCPSGAAPFGSCYAGQCPSGYTCRAGNICC